MTDETRDLAKFIADMNGGAVSFNLGNAARIIGRCRTTIPAWLKKYGVPVEDHGKEKRVLVTDLALGLIREKEQTRMS